MIVTGVSVNSDLYKSDFWVNSYTFLHKYKLVVKFKTLLYFHVEVEC